MFYGSIDGDLGLIKDMVFLHSWCGRKVLCCHSTIAMLAYKTIHVAEYLGAPIHKGQHFMAVTAPTASGAHS